VKRLFLALLCGIFISLALFWLMQGMLMSNPQTIKKTDSLNMMEFVRLKRESPKPKVEPKKPPEKKVLAIQGGKPETKKQVAQPQKISKVQKPVAKQVAPKVEMPKLDIPDLKTDTEVQVSKSAFVGNPDGKKSTNTGSSNGGNAKSSSGTGTGTGKGKGAGASSGLIALKRVEPKYPARAMSRHIEGWVKVEFTVTTTGSVRNARVAVAEPSGIFDEAALNAISQYRFKPEISDGVATERKGTQKFSFKLNK
jgi:periplasmic protein TonB